MRRREVSRTRLMRASADDAAMKSSKASKDERRARRKDRDRAPQRYRGVTVTPLGGTMDRELFDRVLAAAQRLDLDAPWSEVASLVLPILRRIHHPYPPEAAPIAHLRAARRLDRIRHRLRAGLHAHHRRSGRALGRRPRDAARHRAREPARAVVVEPPRIERIHAPMASRRSRSRARAGARRSSSCRSSSAPILGQERRLLLAPVRNTLVALPETMSTRTSAFRMWDAIAEGCHDELDLNLLRWTGTTVVADGDEARPAELTVAERRRRLARWFGPGRLQLGRVVVQPPPPGPVIGPPGRDERPERGSVPEHAQMRELVDDHGLERLGRGEDEPPRQRHPAALRGTPPAGARVTEVMRRGLTPRAGACPATASSIAVGEVAKPRLDDHGVGSRITVGAVDDELVGSKRERPSTVVRRAPRVRPGSVQLGPRRMDPPSRAPPRAANSAAPSAWRARWRRTHGSPFLEELDGTPLAVGRPGAGRPAP